MIEKGSIMEYKDGVITEQFLYKNNEKIVVTTSKEIDLAKLKVATMSVRLFGIRIVITSVIDTDPKRVGNTKHKPDKDGYVNAFDIRTRIYTKEQCDILIKLLREELGRDYDVVDERYDENGELVNWQHIHIEYDPK